MKFLSLLIGLMFSIATYATNPKQDDDKIEMRCEVSKRCVTLKTPCEFSGDKFYTGYAYYTSTDTINCALSNGKVSTIERLNEPEAFATYNHPKPEDALEACRAGLERLVLLYGKCN
jgi:hypothetical protein